MLRTIGAVTMVIAVEFVPDGGGDGEGGEWPWFVFPGVLAIGGFYSFCVAATNTVLIATFMGWSDPAMGGTYFTLFTTANHFGMVWPDTVSLALTQAFSSIPCEGVDDLNECNGSQSLGREECEGLGGVCNVRVDGYWLAPPMLAVAGVIVYKCWAEEASIWLQSRPGSVWMFGDSESGGEVGGVASPLSGQGLLSFLSPRPAGSRVVCTDGGGDGAEKRLL